jgi:hypothetical protein
MLQLYKLNFDKYSVLFFNGENVELNRVQTIDYLRKLSMTDDEISLGIEALEDGHDLAQYDTDLRFVFSRKFKAS